MIICKINKELFSLNLTQSYRSQYGSTNPTAILGPAMIATFCSTLAGIIFAKIMACLPEPEAHTYNKKGGRL